MRVDFLTASQTTMKNLLIFLILFAFSCTPQLHKASFDYGQAWEEVYLLELHGLPESASQKVDSIYTFAKQHADGQQRIKAIIYQSKFLMLLADDSQNKVIDKLRNEIGESTKPISNILESILAGFYRNYLVQNNYQISRRSTISVPTEDFSTWDEQTFLHQISKHFENSLSFDSAHVQIKIDDYREILSDDSTASLFRPLLFDLLAHRAIAFWGEREKDRKTSLNRFRMDDRDLLMDDKSFSTLSLSHPDSSSFLLKAIRLFQKLTRLHAQNDSDFARMDVALGRRKLVYKNSNFDEPYLESLKRLYDKYESREVSGFVGFEIASYYNKKADIFIAGQEKRYQFERTKAKAVCDSVIRHFPRSLAAAQCGILRDNIVESQLSFALEEYLLPDKPTKLQLTYKNYSKLHFTTYRVNHDLNHQVALPWSDSLRTAYLDSLLISKQWSADVKNEFDYQLHKTEVLLPPHELGQYLLTISDTQGKYLTSQIIQVTNLALINHENGDNSAFRIVERMYGRPRQGVKVSIRNRYWGKDTAEVKIRYSDEHGVVRIPVTKESNFFDLELREGTDVAFFDENYAYNSPRRDKSSGSEQKAEVFMFTDRKIYRPGHKVFFKGILSLTETEEPAIIPGQEITVYLRDTRNQVLDSVTQVTNEFGSVSGVFELPVNIVTGGYRLAVDQAHFNEALQKNISIKTDYYFSLEEYKAPAFELFFDDMTEPYIIGDTITITGRAQAFAGSVLTDARVKYRVSRYLSLFEGPYLNKPRQVREQQVIARGEVNTSGDGSFTLKFTALPDPAVSLYEKTIYGYTVEIDVTDLNGETRSKRQLFNLGYDSCFLSIEAKELDLRQEANKIWVKAHSFNGIAQAVEGILEVYKLKAPDFPKREFLWDIPDYPGFEKDIHDSLFSEYPYQYEADAATWPSADLKLSRELTTSDEKAVLIRNMRGWTAGYYRAVFTTKSGLQASSTFRVKDSRRAHIADQQLFELDIDKSVYAVGDTVKVNYGTAAEEMHVTIWVERKGQGITNKFTARLSNEVRTFQIPISGSDEGGIGIYYYYVYHNFFKAGRLAVNIPYKPAALQLETTTFRDKLEPGSDQEWSFTVKDQKGGPARAELLASMYDVSMDHLAPNHWRFSPLLRQPFFPYNETNSNRGFSVGLSGNSHYNDPLYIPELPYPGFNWYGLSFNLYRDSQETYLDDLRWRHSPRPYFFSTTTEQLSGMLKGRILDETGFPMSDAVVELTALNKWVRTDAGGFFELNATDATLLKISFYNYKSYYLELGSDNYFEIVMAPESAELSELRALISPLKGKTYALSFATREVSNKRISYGPWPPIARSARDMTENELLSVKTGRGDYSGKPDRDLSFSISDNVANFGDVNPQSGLSTITTGSTPFQQDILLANVKTRTNLKETAFFFPQLHTDSRGRLTFKFKTSEALTRWKMQLLAHDQQLNSQLLSKTVVTQKKLMLLPNAPRFFREGDAISFSAKVASLSEDRMEGVARLELYDEISGELLTGIITGTENQAFQLAPKGNTNISWRLSIPEGLQAIRYKIVAATNDFSDGEENVIPVLTNRMLVQESVPLWAGANSTKTFSLDKLRVQQSTTLKHHNLTLTMTTNPVWEAIQNLPYLMEYPYECAEQTFARYYANSLGAHIVESFPTIRATFEKWAASGATVSKLEQNPELKALMIEETPWLREAQNQTAQQKRLAMLFESARMKEQLKASLDQLSNMQLSNGAFPWFAGSNRPNRYITQHIMAGLAHLKKLTGNSDVDAILSKGRAFMDQELISSYKKDLKRMADRTTRPADIGFSQVQYLYVKSLLSAEESSEELAAAVSFYQNEAFASWQKMDLQSQAMTAMFANSAGQAEVSDQIIRSLKEFSTSNPGRGIYWKSNQVGWYNWEAPVETQALLIEAFETLTEDDTFIDGMKQWLLAEKRTKSWKTTKATTEAIYALLFRGLDWTAENDNVNVSLGGATVLQGESNEATAGAGYFKKSWQADEIKREMANVVVENNGATIAFGGLYWQYFEDLDKITEAIGPLSLEKQLFKVTQGATGEELVAVEEETLLTLGDLVRVRIVLRSDRSMEFIHLKDMRASGFESVNVLSGYKWQDGLGYYESTRDAATNFFIGYLPKGTFVFEYDLRVNNAGDFSNGITSIQNMYAPEFSSHSEGVRVRIRNEE
jgi:uncharacterized protein YfaS (alpha-2-macroglobulin family)